MADETDCVNALTAMFGAVPAGLALHNFTTGYLYQAVVFEAVGRQLALINPHTWQWHDINGVRTFAYTAGASLHASLHELSRCSHINGTDHFVQGLTVHGLSGIAHHLDATKVRTEGHNATWPSVPSSNWVRCTLECKNHGGNLSLDVGREMVGLRYELSLPYHPLIPRLWIVASQGVTENAERLVWWHGGGVVQMAHPASPPTWAVPIACLVALL